MGYQFLRQRPILNYIADFMFRELKLIIEIDGVTHDFKMVVDRERDIKLSEIGYFTLRFTDIEVMDNIEALKDVLRIG